MRSTPDGNPTPLGDSIAIDAVGIAEGGGLEVVHDIVAECLRCDWPIAAVHLYVSSPSVAQSFADLDRVHVTIVSRSYRRRVLWWCLEGVVRARRAECSAILHMANIALGPSLGLRRAVFFHQAKVLPRAAEDGLRFRGGRIALLRLLVAFSLRLADVVFCQTRAIAAALASWRGDDVDIRIASPTVPSSFTTLAERGSAAPEGYDFIYLGSAERHKNLGVIYHAVPEVRRRLPSARFVLSTSRDEQAPDDGVLFLGNLPRPSAVSWLRQSFALIMPSHLETVGLPMLEAMHVGVPVIAANLPYARAICGDAAVYFESDDPASLTAACTGLVESPDLRAAVVQAGFSRIDAFSRMEGARAVARWLSVGH